MGRTRRSSATIKREPWRVPGLRSASRAPSTRCELRPDRDRPGVEAEPRRQRRSRSTPRRAARAHVHPRDARARGAAGRVGVVAGHRRRRETIGGGARRRVRQDRTAGGRAAAELAGRRRPRRAAAFAPPRPLRHRIHAQPDAGAASRGAGRQGRAIAERDHSRGGAAAAGTAHAGGTPGIVHELRRHGGTDRLLRSAACAARRRRRVGGRLDGRHPAQRPDDQLQQSGGLQHDARDRTDAEHGHRSIPATGAVGGRPDRRRRRSVFRSRT